MTQKNWITDVVEQASREVRGWPKWMQHLSNPHEFRWFKLEKPFPWERDMIDLCRAYDAELKRIGVFAVDHSETASENGDGLGKTQKLEHARWMLGSMISAYETDPHDHDVTQAKLFNNADIFNRWLGFVQCALWSCGTRTIQALRDETRGKTL